MIRLSKLTDYGFVVLNRFAGDGEDVVRNAPELAEETCLPLPTVSKLLKALARGGLLTARRGAKGGYSLARPAEAIRASDVIEALEGPVALTDCSGKGSEDCSIEANCPVRTHWALITTAVRQALDKITLADLAGTPEQAQHRLDAPAAIEPAASCGCGGHGNGCGPRQQHQHHSGASCACGNFQAHTRGDGQ